AMTGPPSASVTSTVTNKDKAWSCRIVWLLVCQIFTDVAAADGMPFPQPVDGEPHEDAEEEGEVRYAEVHADQEGKGGDDARDDGAEASRTARQVLQG